MGSATTEPGTGTEMGAPSSVDCDARPGGLLDNPSQLLLTLACLVIVVMGMRYAASVLNLVLVGLFVVMGLSPVVDWLRRKKVPGWLTITIVLVVFLALAAALVAILSSYVNRLGLAHRRLQDQADLDDRRHQRGWFGGHGVDTSAFFANYVNVESIANSVSTLLGSVVDAFTNVFLMVMVVLFMLAQVYSFPRRVYSRLNLSERFARELQGIRRGHPVLSVHQGVAGGHRRGHQHRHLLRLRSRFRPAVGHRLLRPQLHPQLRFRPFDIPPFVVTLLEYGFTRAALVVARGGRHEHHRGQRDRSALHEQERGAQHPCRLPLPHRVGLDLGPVGALISVPLTLMVKLLDTRFLREHALHIALLDRGQRDGHRR